MTAGNNTTDPPNYSGTPTDLSNNISQTKSDAPLELAAANRQREKRDFGNWAQIAQATLTLCILALGIYTYYTTIVPNQQLIGAKEDLLKTNLELSVREKRLNRYDQDIRKFVTVEFARQVLNRAASIPKISLEKPSGGRQYGPEWQRNQIYFFALHKLFGESWQEDWALYLSGEISGRQLIQDVLKSPIVSLLPSSDRIEFQTAVTQFVDNYPDKSAFETPFAAATPNDDIKIGAEEQRRVEIHRHFVDGIVVLLNSLNDSPKWGHVTGTSQECTAGFACSP